MENARPEGTPHVTFEGLGVGDGAGPLGRWNARGHKMERVASGSAVATAKVGADSAPAAPSWLSAGRVPGLDGLRGLSIVLVLIDHTVRTHGFPAAPGLRRLQFIGPAGVDVFFLISGFLITMLLTRELARTQTIRLRAFYYRRMLRLMPAFLAYALVVMALAAVGIVAVPRSDWAWVLTYSVNFHPDPAWEISHIWSLSVEEQFYLTWPLILLAVGPRRAVYTLCGALVCAPLLRLATSIFYPELLVQANFWTPTRVDAIALGCLAALLLQSPRVRAHTSWTGIAALKPVAIALAVLAASLVVSRALPHFGAAFGYSAKVLVLGCGFWIVLHNAHTRMLGFLEWKPLTVLGLLSYSLYLWQQLLINPTRSEWIFRWPQNLVVALIAAGASYLLVESRFLRMKTRLSGTRPPCPGTHLIPLESVADGPRS